MEGTKILSTDELARQTDTTDAIVATQAYLDSLRKQAAETEQTELHTE